MTEQNLEHFLRMADVQAATGLGRSTLYRLVAEGQFPRPVKILGDCTSGWLASEVSAWQQERIAKRDNEKVA